MLQHKLSTNIESITRVFEAKGLELQNIKIEILEAEETKKKTQEDIKPLEEKKVSLLKDIESISEELKESLRQSKTDISLAKLELDSVNKNISERRKYLFQQEELINSAIEDGNEELKSIKLKIEASQRDEQDAQNYIWNTRNELEDLLEKVDLAKKELVSIENATYKALEDRKKSIVEQERKLQELLKDNEAISKDIDKKSVDLTFREKAIAIKQDYINKQTNDLNTRERRLNTLENLYENVII